MTDDKTRITSRTPATETPTGTVFVPRTPTAQQPAQLVEPVPTSHSQHNSTGFAEAQAIAQRAEAGNSTGSLLKKRFYLAEVLGEGGMGTVYKTKDLRKVEAEDPNPYIATKVLNQAFKDHPDAFVTLQQEAAKSHTLAHPNIVTVHDFDRDGDTLFMTMELLDGDPLDRLIKTQRHKGLAKEQALAIVRDLCAALAYAHQRHIIHADFKPGNVFVTRDGTAKVLDFGIARAASKETQKHKFDTASLGALTPAYATIEMVNNQALTFADDVYALACVTYEIFTGRHPYNGKSALEAKQLGLKPTPPDNLTGREWKALSHALALDKSQRTATVADFMGELFPRRRSLLLVAALVLLAIALGGVAWFSYSQHQEKLKIQNTVNENLQQANECFAQGDYQCALERSLVASNLDSSNQAASQLVKNSQAAQQQQKIATLLAAGEVCLAAQDVGCAQVKARDALSLQAKNPRAQQLLTAANDLEQNKSVSNDIEQAEACLLDKNFACAEMFARKSAEQSPDHPGVKALQEKLRKMQEQAQQLQQAQQQKIDAQLLLAENCFVQRKYDCAIKQSNIVLGLDSSNSRALEIKHLSATELQQGRDAQEKVNRILAQALECLDRQKNYSCAIAKAESALDIMPDNAEALAIKSRAQETQRKIKETGFNIK